MFTRAPFSGKKAIMNNRLGSAFAHLPLIGCSFAFSSMIIATTSKLSPGGEDIDAVVGCLVVVHLAAVVVCLFFTKVSKLSGTIVFLVGFSLPLMWRVDRLLSWYDRRSHALNDRFNEEFGISPASVTNLRFLELEETIRPDLGFRFNIQPDDFWIGFGADCGLVRVELNQLLDPRDPFHRSYYLPIREDWELFQGKDRYDNVLTIKTNLAHTEVVFRKQSSNYYRDLDWGKRVAPWTREGGAVVLPYPASRQLNFFRPFRSTLPSKTTIGTHQASPPRSACPPRNAPASGHLARVVLTKMSVDLTFEDSSVQLVRLRGRKRWTHQIALSASLLLTCQI